MRHWLPPYRAWEVPQLHGGLAGSRPRRAGGAVLIPRPAGEEPALQVKSKGRLLGNSLWLPEAALLGFFFFFFSLFRPLRDWVKSIHIMEGSLLDSKSTDLNVTLIQTHLPGQHINSQSHHPSSHPVPSLSLGPQVRELTLAVLGHFCF